MKKVLKITLITLLVIFILLVLDTIQARIFHHSPIISFKETMGESYVDKGIFMDTYYCVQENDEVTVSYHSKHSKFACPVVAQEKTFLGQVLEVKSTYIMVKPNEGTEEIKSVDKFKVNFSDDDNQQYKEGSTVKITYSGLIFETYPAQIDATKVELISNAGFELIFNETSKEEKKKIIDSKKDTNYDYDVYLYYGTMDIIVDAKKYSLEDALKNNLITIDEIIAKADEDIPDAPVYKDGGSKEYNYDNYKIIKMHKLDGNNNIYFGSKDLDINDID